MIFLWACSMEGDFQNIRKNGFGLMPQNYSYGTLRFYIPCLYREAMHLHCFPPSCYVRGMATHTQQSLPDLLKIALECLLALCGPTLHVALLSGHIHSFAVLYTEKLAFSVFIAKLAGSYTSCFQIIFSCLVCQ